MQIQVGSNTFRVLFPDLLRPLNPEERAGLRQSIERDGVTAPVLVDEEGGIIDGANRARIAAELGLPGIPTRTLAGLDDEAKHRLALELNLSRRHLTPAEQQEARQKRVARVVEARREGKSYRAIAEEVGVSKTQVGLDLQSATVQGCTVTPDRGKVTGLDGREQPARRQSSDATPHREKREAVRQARLEAIPPALFQPEWEIVTGDCIEVLSRQSAGCARLVFADPPYNLGVDYGRGAEADRKPQAEFIAWCREWVAQCVRILTDDGSLWFLINAANASRVDLLLEDAGLYRRSWIVWYESFGQHLPNNFGATSRHLFYCVKDRKRFVFNADAIRVESARQSEYNDARANPLGKIPDNVWVFPRVAGTHGEVLPGGFKTQLPVEMLNRVVLCASDPGDLVCDPFNGSGTSGEAAIAHGRRYLGVEENAERAAVARERLKRVPCREHVEV